MSGVPREILRWLQSLDLSYSVKNPRRDLANGFLVAEIFSRYYRHDISMHSFENSFSQRRKIDNWRCLERLFVKARIPITRSIIDRVLVAEPGAAILLLKTIYTLLTKKRVPSPEPFDEKQFLPPFARPTASAVVKEKAHDAGDETMEKVMAQKTIEAHENVIRQERLEHPDRFMTAGAGVHEKSVMRSSSHRISEHILVPDTETRSVNPAQQFVKQVVVKQIDEQQIIDLQSAIDKNRKSAPPDPGRRKSIIGAPSTQLKTVNEILDEVVGHRLQPGMKAAELVQSVGSLQDGREIALQIIADLLDPGHITSLAEIMLQSTTQFWAMITTITPLLHGRRHDLIVVQRSAAQLLGQIGKSMSLSDEYRAQSMFIDFALPVVIDLIVKRSPIISDLISAMFCFGPQTVDGQIDLVQRLHESLKSGPYSDLDLFVCILAEVSQLQTEFNHRSLDLFLYYTMMGMKSASPLTRAASMRIATALVRCPDAIEPMIQSLDLFEECANDDWAQVQLQLVRLVWALLVHLPDPSSSRGLDQIRHMLLTITASASNTTLISMVLIMSEYMMIHDLAQEIVLHILQHHDPVRNALLKPADDRKNPVPDLILDEIRRVDAASRLLS